MIVSSVEHWDVNKFGGHARHFFRHQLSKGTRYDQQNISNKKTASLQSAVMKTRFKAGEIPCSVMILGSKTSHPSSRNVYATSLHLSRIEDENES